MLLVLVAIGTWAAWRVIQTQRIQATYHFPTYDSTLADQDYGAGQKRILVLGLNTARPELPTALVERGVTYFDVAGCVPLHNSLSGIAAYNERMRELLQRETGLDLSQLSFR